MKIEDEIGLETFHLFHPIPLPQALAKSHVKV